MTEVCNVPTGPAVNYLTDVTEFGFFTFAQWLCLLTEIVFVPVYAYASISIYLTHREFTFDMGVMLLGLLLNLLVLLDTFVYCVDLVVIVYNEVTVLILLFFCLLLVHQIYKMD